MTKATISRSAALIAAAVLGVVGIALLVLAVGLDWGGFAGGLAMGVGVGFALAGAYFWGYANGLRAPGVRASWRPSDDAAA